MVFHHVSGSAFRYLFKFCGLVICLFRIPDVLFCQRNIMSGKLLLQFPCKSLAARDLPQRFRIYLIGIPDYLGTALDKFCLNLVNNRNDFLYIHVANIITVFHHPVIIFLRHSIRHNCHIVSLRGNVDLPCILHNLFCGLSLTFISRVIHNCARNV